MEPSLILGLILGVVSALVVLPLLIHLWPKQGQWGINTKPVGQAASDVGGLDLREVRHRV